MSDYEYSDNSDYEDVQQTIKNKKLSKNDILNIENKYKTILSIPKYRNELEDNWYEYLYDNLNNDLLDLLKYYIYSNSDTDFLNYIDEDEFKHLIFLIYHHLEPKYNFNEILQNKKKMNKIFKIKSKIKDFKERNK